MTPWTSRCLRMTPENLTPWCHIPTRESIKQNDLTMSFRCHSVVWMTLQSQNEHPGVQIELFAGLWLFVLMTLSLKASTPHLPLTPTSPKLALFFTTLIAVRHHRWILCFFAERVFIAHLLVWTYFTFLALRTHYEISSVNTRSYQVSKKERDAQLSPPCKYPKKDGKWTQRKPCTVHSAPPRKGGPGPADSCKVYNQL